jgi:hypothetical protein
VAAAQQALNDYAGTAAPVAAPNQSFDFLNNGEIIVKGDL